MGIFQAREGLYEFTLKRLGANEREEAVARIAKNVRTMDAQLKEFLNIGNKTDDDPLAVHKDRNPTF